MSSKQLQIAGNERDQAQVHLNRTATNKIGKRQVISYFSPGLGCPSRAPEEVVVLVARVAATDTPAVQKAASKGTSQRAYLGRGIAFRSQVLAWVAARRVQLDRGLQEGAAPGLPSDLVSGFGTPTTTEAVASVQAADPMG
jgi:hypothetical protein